MNPSHLKQILDQAYASVSSFNIFMKILPSKEYRLLREFYHRCLQVEAENNVRQSLIQKGKYGLSKDLPLTIGQLFQFYSLITLNQTNDPAANLISAALFPLETRREQKLRLNLAEINQVYGLPPITDENRDYEALGAFIERLEPALFEAKYLKEIFNFFNVRFVKENFLAILPYHMMTKKNFDVLGIGLGYNKTSYLGYALDKLNSGVLNQANFDELSQSPKLCYILSLFRGRFLTKELWQSIHDHLEILYNATHFENIKRRFNFFKRNHLEQFITICEEANGDENKARANLHSYICKIALIKSIHSINPPHSTTEPSVHKTASETALNYKKRYGDKINNINDIFDEISIYLQMLSEKTYHQSTLLKKRGENLKKKCDELESQPEPYSVNLQLWQENQKLYNETTQYSYQICKAMTTFANYQKMNPQDSFVDPISKISSREFLALTWLAINDEQWIVPEGKTIEEHMKFFATKEDKRTKFVIAIYDMRRGYNQDDNLRDNFSSVDFTICEKGDFNKMAEIGWAIHPEAPIIYLTIDLATRKFPIIVREELESYLSTLQTSWYRNNFPHAIQQLHTEGINTSWNQIKAAVTKRVLDEYGPLFEKDNSLSIFLSSYKEVDIKAVLKKFDSQTAETNTAQFRRVKM